jgi:2-polyprenyl-6-methoxyphenol hydroxylase-like FAD-dependent oxidoreductase
MSPTALRVLVIGAGTGGLALAHGLVRAGIDVQVFERDALRTDGLHGYRVGIDPDGSRALNALLPPDLYETFVTTCARAPSWFNMITEQLKEVLALEIPREGDPVESEKSVSRMTLRQVLMTGLEDVITFGKEFTGFEQHGDGTVTAYFADGSTATGDLLVGPTAPALGSASNICRRHSRRTRALSPSPASCRSPTSPPHCCRHVCSKASRLFKRRRATSASCT